MSPDFKLYTTFLNIANHGEITTKLQIYRNRAETAPNRNFRQFNNDQYCSIGKTTLPNGDLDRGVKTNTPG